MLETTTTSGHRLDHVEDLVINLHVVLGEPHPHRQDRLTHEQRCPRRVAVEHARLHLQPPQPLEGKPLVGHRGRARPASSRCTRRRAPPLRGGRAASGPLPGCCLDQAAIPARQRRARRAMPTTAGVPPDVPPPRSSRPVSASSASSVEPRYWRQPARAPPAAARPRPASGRREPRARGRRRQRARRGGTARPFAPQASLHVLELSNRAGTFGGANVGHLLRLGSASRCRSSRRPTSAAGAGAALPRLGVDLALLRIVSAARWRPRRAVPLLGCLGGGGPAPTSSSSSQCSRRDQQGHPAHPTSSSSQRSATRAAELGVLERHASSGKRGGNGESQERAQGPGRLGVPARSLPRHDHRHLQSWSQQIQLGVTARRRSRPRRPARRRWRSCRTSGTRRPRCPRRAPRRPRSRAPRRRCSGGTTGSSG